MACKIPSASEYAQYAPLAEALQDAGIFLTNRLAPLLDLSVRIWLAQIFFASGVVKTATWDATIWLYTYEHPVPGLAPETAAWLGTGAELVCSVLLVAGLFTRIAALPLLFITVFLQFTYKSLDLHWYWMALLGLLIVRGPAPLSLDHLLAPHLARSAVPLAGVLHRAGRALSLYGGPIYLFILRLGMAYVFVSATVVYATTAGDTLFSLKHIAVFAIAGLLAFGLGTRLMALLLMVLVSAQVMADETGVAFPQVLLPATFVLCGAGQLSLDALLASTVRRLFPSLESDPAWLANAPRIVIVGAGFGGIAAALGLRHAWARVTLIDRRNYHLFQPLLYQVATASLSPADIATPIRAVLRGQPNCRVVMGRVTSIDITTREVVVDNRRIPYDALVLATGARHSYFGRDDWESLAPGLKKIDDATAIRGRILSAFERAETCDDEEERGRLLTFVIVGGGPTGVEMAGAIAELARHGMHEEFRTVDPASARVFLIQSGARVLPGMPEQLSTRAKGALEQLGVEVLLDTRVEQVDGDGVLAAGQRIEARTVLWAAGVTASAAGRWIGAPQDNAGRILVDRDLSVPNLDNVFALGDTAACPSSNGGMLPGLAAVAKQQGYYVAKLLRARIEGRHEPGPFRYRDYGSMATIGRKSAVADLLGLRLSGSAAWWLWSAVHVAFLVDVRSRLAVLFDWFWSYLTYNRGMRLITCAESSSD